MAKKNPAAVALGRAGGRRGGPARAAKLTPAQRSESARKAVQARWAKARKEAGSPVGASDDAMLDILQQIKAASSATEIQRLSEQLERAIFHRPYKAS
jgi:hypothetical protein